MTQPLDPPASPQLTERRRQLAPGVHGAFRDFSAQMCADGALEALATAGLAHGPRPV